jgi:hypothetical protein
LTPVCCKTQKISRLLTGLSAAGVLATSAWAQSGVVTDVAVLPDISLGVFQNTYLPGSVGNDHGFKLGGIGSGVWRGPGDGPGIFWMTTDRGPNPQTPAPIKRSFPVPTFTPFLLKVKAQNGVIQILEALPVTGSNGMGVTGLPNDPSAASPASPAALRDEQPFNCNVSAVIPGNPDGHDIEDIVRDVHGNFWTVDEYGPSITKIDATGRVVKRFVPQGREFVSGVNFTVVGNLPQILGRRPRNRGFEGVAITPNNRTLLAVVQSPLTNQTTAIGNASRVIRIIEFDIPTETVTGEYVYVMQKVSEFSHTNPTEMKISAITALDQHRFLVVERTDAIAKVYKIDLRKATNILGTKWDDTTTAPSLETLAAFSAPNSGTNTLAANGVEEVAKELVIDLSTLGSVILPKIEGLTVLDGRTIVVSNDNDFQVGAPTCDANVPPPPAPAPSRLVTIRLDKPIK